MVDAVRAVMLDVPAALLAERRQLGLDRFDEMWEGELHMVPPPNEEHQRIGTELVAALYAVTRAQGLQLRYETGVFDPEVTGDSSYRTPDVVVFGDEVRSARGVEGGARMVVEIRSPGDESLHKLAFFQRVGVAEVLVIGRDDKSLRRWLRRDDRLVELAAGDDGWHRLDAIPVALHGGDGRLELVMHGAGAGERLAVI